MQREDFRVFYSCSNLSERRFPVGAGGWGYGGGGGWGGEWVGGGGVGVGWGRLGGVDVVYTGGYRGTTTVIPQLAIVTRESSPYCYAGYKARLREAKKCGYPNLEVLADFDKLVSWRKDLQLS